MATINTSSESEIEMEKKDEKLRREANAVLAYLQHCAVTLGWRIQGDIAMYKDADKYKTTFKEWK